MTLNLYHILCRVGMRTFHQHHDDLIQGFARLRMNNMTIMNRPSLAITQWHRLFTVKDTIHNVTSLRTTDADNTNTANPRSRRNRCNRVI